MKQLFIVATIFGIFLSGCNQDEASVQEIQPETYTVQSVQALEQRLVQLNEKLSADYLQMKQIYGYAFSNTTALDANNLKSLNVQAVSATALKPVKEHYCSLMNGYFAELYRLGRFNLTVVETIKLNNAPTKGLATQFVNTASFYQFVMEEHSTYKQAQQLMGFGCNLRAALSPIS